MKLRSDNAILKAKQRKLESAVADEKQLIENQKKDFEDILDANNKMNALVTALKNDLDDVICRDTKSKTDVTQTDFAVEEDKDETVFKTKKDKKTSKTLEDFFAF